MRDSSLLVRTTAIAALDITVTSGTTAAIFPELIREEGLQPWKRLEEVCLFGPGSGETVVDVTAGFERKMAALQAHASQIGDWDVRATLAGHMAATGEALGYRYAESFRVISFRR